MATFSWSDIGQNASEGGGAALPLGEFRGVVEKGNHRLNNKGNPSFGFLVRIEGGPNDGAKGWWNMNITPDSPASNGYNLRLFAGLGITVEMLAQLPDAANITSETNRQAVVDLITGRVGIFTVAMGKANGGYAAKPEVKAIKPVENAAPVTPTTAQAQQTPGAAPKAPF